MPRTFAVVFLILALAAGAAPSVAAQDASPMASPSAGTCTAPVLPSATPDAKASATQGNTPAATPEPVGTPADQALIDRVVAAEENLIACLNAGEYDVVIAVHSPEAVRTLFGTADPAEAAAILEGFPLVEILAVENVQVLGDGRISAEVAYTEGGQSRRTRDYWVDQDGVLLFAGFDVLPVESGTPTP